MHILDFAKEGNADETYAKIREWQDRIPPREIEENELVSIANEYEADNLEDIDFCRSVVENLDRTVEFIYDEASGDYIMVEKIKKIREETKTVSYTETEFEFNHKKGYPVTFYIRVYENGYQTWRDGLGRELDLHERDYSTFEEFEDEFHKMAEMVGVKFEI